MSQTTTTTAKAGAFVQSALRVCILAGELVEVCRLHTGQIEALQEIEAAPGSRFVLEVARRWGKTWLLLTIAFMACLRTPKVRVVYGAPTLKHLAEFVLPTFEALAECFPEDLRPHWNAQTGHIEFHNGSWIHLFGADDKRKANRGRGPAAVLAIFDEAGFCPLLRYVLKSVFRPSLLHSGGRTIIGSTPAEEPDHDFTSIAEKAEARGAYFNRTVFDNPLLTKQQIDQFIAEDAGDDGVSVETYIDSDDFRREYMAERVINRLLLAVPEWADKREKHFVRIERPKLFRGHTIIDFGGNDPHAIQLGYWHPEKGLVIEYDKLLKNDERSKVLEAEVKELETEAWGVKKWNGTLAALTTENLAHHFRHGQEGGTTVPQWLMREINKEAQPQPYLRLCDTNMELARHLHSVGVAAVPVHKTEKQFMVQGLRNLIADGRYWVDPRCVDTDRHLRTTTWANDKRKTWARRGGEHGDLVDTSVYFALGAHRDVPVENAPREPPPEFADDGRPVSRLEARLRRR